MKLYCKIKKDGKWCWYVGDSPWKIHVARDLCECRVCSSTKPISDCQEEELPADAHEWAVGVDYEGEEEE